jgi:hypothetical protein
MSCPETACMQAHAWAHSLTNGGLARCAVGIACSLVEDGDAVHVLCALEHFCAHFVVLPCMPRRAETLLRDCCPLIGLQSLLRDLVVLYRSRTCTANEGVGTTSACTAPPCI